MGGCRRQCLQQLVKVWVLRQFQCDFSLAPEQSSDSKLPFQT